MAQAYRLDVSDRIGADGSETWMVVGDRIEVDGRDMVRLSHGTIVPADGFSSTAGGARLRAASHIERLSLRLSAQAERLRSQAAIEEATK